MKNDEKLEYDVTDQNANTTDVYSTEETNEDEKAKKRIIIAATVVIAIILLLLGIGFGVKKNKVGAVLNDDVQEELVDGLANYLVEIGGMDEVEAEKMARQLVKENMGSLLVADFLSMDDDAIQQMIDNSITKNNKNYYTKNEADQIVNKFTADVSELRDLIKKNRDSIVQLTNEMNKEFEETNNKIDKNQKEMDEKVEKYRKELDTDIADINDKIDVAQLQTPLISYEWNTHINRPKTTKTVEKVVIDEETGEEKTVYEEVEVDKSFSGSNSGGISDGSSKCNWHVVKKIHDTQEMSIKEYVEALAANDNEFTKSINKLYDYVEDEDQALRTELYDYFNSTMSDWKKDYDHRLANEKQERERDVYNLNQTINEYKDAMATWQEMIDGQLNGRTLWTGTQAEYNALGEKDSMTIYFITD